MLLLEPRDNCFVLEIEVKYLFFRGESRRFSIFFGSCIRMLLDSLSLRKILLDFFGKYSAHLKSDFSVISGEP